MQKKPITIKDIARMLDVSKSTVSRALSDKSDIHPETRKKILELAGKLHYEPNALAIQLKQQKTNTIGIIVPETINRFFSRAIAGIQHRADMAGVNVMICQSNESYITEKKNIHSLLTSRVDGLIVAISRETDRSDHFAALLERGIPLVFFDRICEDLDTSHVVTNNYEIAFEGTEHLILQGCKRISFIAGPQHLYNSSNRLRGYLDALRKHNLAVNDSYIIHSTYRSDKVEQYTRYLMNMPQRPDAIFSINDYAAIETMYILKKNGIRVPEDIAVLGFNNENLCRFLEPSLSSIDHPADQIGIAAAELLINQMHHPEVRPEKRIVKSQLIVRESTMKNR
jgi:DNA-binding LacI/PurR family transcriptional regulator